MTNVFVIQIVSNPDEGVAYAEGNRFANGSFIAELGAPIMLQESARSAHSNAFEEQILSGRKVPRIERWTLSQAQAVEAVALQPVRKSWGISLFDNMASREEMIRRLRTPPLGWTIDPNTFNAVFSASIMLPAIPVLRECGASPNLTDDFCKSLAKSNSTLTKQPSGKYQ